MTTVEGRDAGADDQPIVGQPRETLERLAETATAAIAADQSKESR